MADLTYSQSPSKGSFGKLILRWILYIPAGPVCAVLPNAVVRHGDNIVEKS